VFAVLIRNLQPDAQKTEPGLTTLTERNIKRLAPCTILLPCDEVYPREIRKASSDNSNRRDTRKLEGKVVFLSGLWLKRKWLTAQRISFEPVPP
jgi:hypothetical protein